MIVTCLFYCLLAGFFWFSEESLRFGFFFFGLVLFVEGRACYVRGVLVVFIRF